MSQLTSQIDELLSAASAAYVPEGYLADLVLPSIGAIHSTGKLAKYGNQHLRIEHSITGGKGAFKRVESITRSTSSFSIEKHGLSAIVTDEDYKNVLNPYKAEADEVMGLTAMIMLGKEKALADTLTDSSILTQYTTLTSSDQYSDPLNSDPIDDFSTARATIRAACGLPPNKAFMDWAVFNKLRFHPQMLDALGFKQARPGGLNEQELAIAMGVEKVLIAQAVYNSAVEGQSDSLAAVWGKHVVFAVCPDKAAPYQVSLGYQVGYEGESRKVSKQALFNPPGATEILCWDSYDILISNLSAGYLIKDAIA